MRNEQWIFWELLCIWSDWKSLNGLNFLKDIYIKFRGTEVVHMQECRDESDMYNYQRIQISNNNSLMVLGGTLDLAWL